MPVHFNSFIDNSKEEMNTNLFSSIITEYTQNADNIFVSDDKKSINMESYIKESNTNEIIGKVVITLKVRENSLELVDTDITLKNDNQTNLTFQKKLDKSSEDIVYKKKT